MLDPKSKVAVYMEDHIDSDYGKMGMGVVRYLKNPIKGIVDSKFAGKKINEILEFEDLNRDILIYKNSEARSNQRNDAYKHSITNNSDKAGIILNLYIREKTRSKKTKLSITNIYR